MSKLYALAGDPIASSPSPAMHNAAFAALGLDARYVLRPTRALELPELVDELSRGVLAGANITTPLKVLLAAQVRCEGRAARAGAVNTVWREPGGLRGALTDIDGVCEPLRALKVSGGDALVLGAGGAARAAVLALEELGCAVHVAARRVEQAGHLLDALAPARRGESLGLEAGPALDAALARAHVVVQATPVGRLGEAHPLRWENLQPGAVAFEMLYRPACTPFMVSATAHHARVVSGLSMLVAQGAHAFELWTGKPAPREVMASAAQSELVHGAASGG